MFGLSPERKREPNISFDQEDNSTEAEKSDNFDEVSILAREALERALEASQKVVNGGEEIRVSLGGISSVPDVTELRTEIAALKTDSHHYPLLIGIKKDEKNPVALFQSVSQ